MRTSLLSLSRVGLLLVVISLVLFVLQLVALAYGGMVPISSVVPHGSPAWKFLARADASALLLGAVPAGLVAYVVARTVARGSWARSLGARLPRLACAIWLAVWAGCWLALYALKGGVDPRSWSSVLFSKPQLWYGLVLVAAGLWAGSRPRHVV